MAPRPNSKSIIVGALAVTLIMYLAATSLMTSPDVKPEPPARAAPMPTTDIELVLLRRQLNDAKAKIYELSQPAPTPEPTPVPPAPTFLPAPDELAGYRLMSFGEPIHLHPDAWTAFYTDSISKERNRDEPQSSRIAIASDFRQKWYSIELEALHESHAFHRKQWELVSISRAITDAFPFAVHKGHRLLGCGIAVGDDPLASYFVSRGCHVQISDVSGAHQRASSLEQTRKSALVSKEGYEHGAQFQIMELDNIDGNLKSGQFDFVWSSSAVHRLGTIDRCLQFLLDTAKMLRPGGLAVHTTEFVISDLERNVEIPGEFTMFRKQDVERLADRLREVGATLMKPDWFAGNELNDFLCDVTGHPDRHIRLSRDGVCFTSIMLTIRREF